MPSILTLFVHAAAAVISVFDYVLANVTLDVAGLHFRLVAPVAPIPAALSVTLVVVPICIAAVVVADHRHRHCNTNEAVQ